MIEEFERHVTRVNWTLQNVKFTTNNLIILTFDDDIEDRTDFDCSDGRGAREIFRKVKQIRKQKL